MAIKKTLKFGTWNTQTRHANKTTGIITELSRFNINTAKLSETIKKGQGNKQGMNYIHFWYEINKEQQARSGGGLLVKKSHKIYIKDYNYISKRIITVTIALCRIVFIIIGRYAPTNTYNNTLKII